MFNLTKRGLIKTGTDRQALEYANLPWSPF